MDVLTRMDIVTQKDFSMPNKSLYKPIHYQVTLGEKFFVFNDEFGCEYGKSQGYSDQHGFGYAFGGNGHSNLGDGSGRGLSSGLNFKGFGNGMAFGSCNEGGSGCDNIFEQ